MKHNLLQLKNQALIKMNSKLLSPIEFNYGVKQGDPSSAALYYLALEPFFSLFEKYNGGSWFKCIRTHIHYISIC